MSSLRAYLAYLRQQGWDTPCLRFREIAKELVRHGWARRRWLLFGEYGITRAGLDHLSLRMKGEDGDA